MTGIARAATWRVRPTGADRHAPVGQLTDAPGAADGTAPGADEAAPDTDGGLATGVPVAQDVIAASTRTGIATRTSDDGVAMRAIKSPPARVRSPANPAAVQGTCR